MTETQAKARQMKTAPFKVWEHIGDPETFAAYVAEVRAEERERCAKLAKTFKYDDGTRLDRAEKNF